MEFEKFIIAIEDVKNVHDILYGNSPRQMFKRALKNRIAISLENQFKTNQSLNLLLFYKFQKFLKNCPTNSFYADAIAALYLAIFSKSDSFEVFKKLGDLLPEINNQSLLFQIITFARQELFKSINPQLTISEYNHIPLKLNYQLYRSLVPSLTKFSYEDYFDFKSNAPVLIELK